MAVLEGGSGLGKDFIISAKSLNLVCTHITHLQSQFVHKSFLNHEAVQRCFVTGSVTVIVQCMYLLYLTDTLLLPSVVVIDKVES